MKWMPVFLQKNKINPIKSMQVTNIELILSGTINPISMQTETFFEGVNWFL